MEVGFKKQQFGPNKGIISQNCTIYWRKSTRLEDISQKFELHKLEAVKSVKVMEEGGQVQLLEGCIYLAGEAEILSLLSHTCRGNKATWGSNCILEAWEKI